MRTALWLAISLLASGCVTTTLPASEIQVAEGEQPHVRFTWTPAEPHAGEEVRFIPQARAHAGAKALSWHWRFGDDAWSRDAQPLHVYADDGVHEVRVTLELDDHSRLQHTEGVEILEAAPDRGPEPDAEPGPEDPVPASSPDAGGAKENKTYPVRPHVVVATFDTGTNPFHPCFRRPGSNATTAGIRGFPDDARALDLSFLDSYKASKDASKAELATIEAGHLYHVPETRLLFYGARGEFVDDYPHGAQASSQIVCAEYGLAPEAWLVVLNWYDDRDQGPGYLEWVAAQDWIDVVHLNIQDTPWPFTTTSTRAIGSVIASGKLVVIAAGNGVAGGGANYPMELSSYNGPSGSLIAGANENDGYTYYSNLDPHVVMDGCGTEAAEPDGFDTTSFGGTSSASPRITGYTARLLWEARQAYPDADRGDGSLMRLPDATPVPAGPLSDGILDVAELHEVTRKTADPNPHASEYDGSACIPIPQPVDLPYSFYPKMGYGEVSERTLPLALEVLLGKQAMPERPVADAFYEASEGARETYWG